MVINIISIFFIGMTSIKNKNVLKFIQYLQKNIMELFIISSKISYFFIYEWLKI